MGTERFDDLLLALQMALMRAQDSLRRRREEALLRMYETGEPAGSRAPVYTFAFPRSDQGNDGVELLSLPASSFRSSCCQQVAMLSLEFECELAKIRSRDGARGCALAIKSPRKKRWWRKNRLRMQIVFTGTQQPAGEVKLNDKLLMEIPRYGESESHLPMMAARKSGFTLVQKLLRTIWSTPKYVFTQEQAEQVRNILACGDAESSWPG